MKKTNILYWTFTGLFAAFMLMSGIQNLMVTPEWIALMKSIGYPEYLIPFLGVAKCLGVLTLLVPGYPGIKEWAYAGFFFDITGATYSVIMTEGGFKLPHTFMLVLLIIMGLSYFYHHKRLRQVQEQPVKRSAVAV